MFLKQIELKNFRQYKGRQVIEFSSDPDRNVTLFLGKNTSGKTTLIQAFRWVLYNDCNFTGKKSDEKKVLNSDVRSEMMKGDEEEARVTLIFEHQGITYEIYRAYIFKSKVSGSADYSDQKSLMYYYDSNGEKKVVKGSEGKIGEILPESLSEYFFFDGEKIATIRDSKNVKDSINTIMGLVPLEHMMSHLLGSGSSYSVERMYRESMKDNSETRDTSAKISRTEKLLSDAEKNYEESKRLYTQQDQTVQTQYVEMTKINDAAADAKKLKDVDREIEEIKKKIDKSELDIIMAFAPAISEMAQCIISDKILMEMKDLEYDDKGIPDMTASAVNFILERGRCICGADLNGNESCRRELIELLSFLPPESIGTQIRHMDNELRYRLNEASKRNLFDGIYSQYNMLLGQYEDLEGSHSELENRIGSYKDADVIQSRYRKAVDLREKFNGDMVRYEAEKQRLGNQLESLRHQLSVASKADSFNDAIVDKMGYASALLKRAKDQYSKDAADIFNEVRDTLVDVFNSMYHGRRTIHLTDDYKVMLNVGGELLDNSKGLDTVQNFAFIATLLKVAKSRKSMEFGSESYPLVMDAVFSNTDEVHIKNICDELPKLSEQAILAIMDKDWAIASDTLDGRVGKKYRIVKETETYSHIEAIEGVE